MAFLRRPKSRRLGQLGRELAPLGKDLGRGLLQGVLRTAEQVRDKGALATVRGVLARVARLRTRPALPARLTPSIPTEMFEAPSDVVEKTAPSISPLPASSPSHPSAPENEDRPTRHRTAEPIETRTMARILANQGYTGRALRIYDRLIASAPDDSRLQHEAGELREARLAVASAVNQKTVLS